jgi:hypothetical protein
LTRWDPVFDSLDFRRSAGTVNNIAIIIFSAGYAVSFQVTVLKVLSGHPEGRASLADLTRCVSVLISSGSDWTNRTKCLAARAPKLDIFGDSLVLRDENGWQITDIGRQFLASLEAPIPVTSREEQGPEIDATVSNAPPPVPAPPLLRLVVNNSRRSHHRPGRGPARRSA